MGTMGVTVGIKLTGAIAAVDAADIGAEKKSSAKPVFEFCVAADALVGTEFDPNASKLSLTVPAPPRGLPGGVIVIAAEPAPLVSLVF